MNFTLPKNWNQLTTPQLEWLQTLYNARLEDKAVFLAMAFMGLLNIVVENRDYEDEPGAYLCHMEGKKDDKFLLRPYEIQYFSKQLDWLLKDCTLTKSPYPELKLGKQLFRGPATKLSDFSWQQYKTASDLYFLYYENKSPMHQKNILLAKFIATLFTPERELFNPETQKVEMSFAYSPSQMNLWGVFRRRMKADQMAVVLMFWNGCCTYLANSYRHLYKQSGTKKDDNTKNDMLKTNASISVAIMDRLKLSEEEMNHTSMGTILEVLDIMHLEADKHREWMAKNGR